MTFADCKNTKRAVIAGVIIVVTAVMLSIVNHYLWANSYAYACWRVTHPAGPNVKAFGTVFGMTQPRHIPTLIAQIDESDGWWIESMLLAWFPDAQPPKTEKRAFWTQWWKEHQEMQLLAHHDPQF